MVLAVPGPLLTPPPSPSPLKTPHRSYSAQTRSQFNGCWRGTCRVGLWWRGGGRRGRGTDEARSRQCGAAQRSCAGAGHLPRAGAQLWTASFCWGVAGAMQGCDTGRSVGGGLQSEAALIDVRLDVGSLPPRSSSQTVAGRRVGWVRRFLLWIKNGASRVAACFCIVPLYLCG